MIHALTIGFELDQHVGCAGRHIDAQDAVVGAGGEKLIPIDFAGVVFEAG